jgi:hypothetical protein
MKLSKTKLDFIYVNFFGPDNPIGEIVDLRFHPRETEILVQ